MNLPDILYERLYGQLGADQADFEAALDTPAPVSIRLNPLKPAPLPTDDPVPWAAGACYLPERPRFALDPRWHAGAYYVQEASSMLVGLALQQHTNPHRPLRVLDLCAAPGGKSTHLAALLPPGSLLVANEVIRSRAHILAENLIKWGHPAVLVSNNDPRDFQRLPHLFDVLLVDAPCSGEGLIRRDPAALDEWSPQHLALCTDRQRRILLDAWDTLRPGGLLLYSTCTFHPGENADNLRWLAAQVGVSSLTLDLPAAWGWETVVGGGITAYQAWPHRVRGEGFFLAVLHKEAGAVQPPRYPRRPTLATAPRALRDRVADWTDLPADAALLLYGETLLAWPTADIADVDLLVAQLRIEHLGLPLAEPKQKDLRPHPALALSPLLRQGVFPTQVLDREAVLRYLRREAPTLDLPDGWGLVQYEGLGLGWVKVMQRRVNNYYPQHWRLRMEIGL
ncbi:MAG: rRNA cytosine-C5-methyltransferase [Bacteroidia bacterium]